MFDLVPASSQRITVPATVVTKDSFTVSLWLQPDFAPDSATVYNIIDVTGIRYRLYHSGANTWTMYADGYTKTFDVTSLWIAGQLIHVKATWIKTGTVLTLAINGTEITPSAGSGAWVATAVGATLFVGSDVSSANYFDGDVAGFAVLNRATTAAELALLAAGNRAKEVAPSGLMWSSPLEINAQADYNPGGEEATVTGSPAISQHPLILRRGPRALVEGFQSVNGTFENTGWTLTGTPTADTLIESIAAPAGTDPALGAQVLHVKHLATDAMSIYRYFTLPSTPRGSVSFYAKVTTAATARGCVILSQTGNLVAGIYLSAALQTLYRYTGSSVAANVTWSATRWTRFCVTWDSVAGTVSWSINGVTVGSFSDLSTSRTVNRVAIGWQATDVDAEYHLAGLDIRSDRVPDALYGGAYDLDGTADYLTAPQAVATAIQDEGAVVMMVRPDFLPAEGTLRQLFSAAEGANYLRCSFSATANRIYLYNNARSGYGASTALWSAGQWIQLTAQWKKSTDLLEVYLNGTSLGTLTKAGTWGALAVSSVLAIGATSTAANKLDGAIGDTFLYNRILSASEISDLSKGHDPGDVSARYSATTPVYGWEGGKTSPRFGSEVLTRVGAPAVVRGPGIQEARGAVLARCHFEGTGYEQSGWTVTGTPTADTLIDPDCTRPVGWPAWAGQPCRCKQLATENAMSLSRTIGAADVDTLYYREVLYVATLPGGTCEIMSLDGAAARTIGLEATATQLRLVHHIAAGDQTTVLATLYAGKDYYVEIAYSVSGQWVAYRVNGHLGNKAWTRITGVVLDRGGARTLYLRTSTVTTYSIDMYRGGLEVRTDHPSSTIAAGIQGTNPYLFLNRA